MLAIVKIGPSLYRQRHHGGRALEQRRACSHLHSQVSVAPQVRRDAALDRFWIRSQPHLPVHSTRAMSQSAVSMPRLRRRCERWCLNCEPRFDADGKVFAFPSVSTARRYRSEIAFARKRVPDNRGCLFDQKVVEHRLRPRDLQARPQSAVQIETGHRDIGFTGQAVTW